MTLFCIILFEDLRCVEGSFNIGRVGWLSELRSWIVRLWRDTAWFEGWWTAEKWCAKNGNTRHILWYIKKKSATHFNRLLYTRVIYTLNPNFTYTAFYEWSHLGLVIMYEYENYCRFAKNTCVNWQLIFSQGTYTRPLARIGKSSEVKMRTSRSVSRNVNIERWYFMLLFARWVYHRLYLSTPAFLRKPFNVTSL